MRRDEGRSAQAHRRRDMSLTPQDINDRYHVLAGRDLRIWPATVKFTGAFKPANRSASKFKGLYLAGGAAHPGPGMPMVMMSGWIAADALDHDLAASAVDAVS
jgi:diapolycopene oxygenase